MRTTLFCKCPKAEMLFYDWIHYDNLFVVGMGGGMKVRLVKI